MVQPAGKSALIEKLSVNEKELNELAELLRELEETLARLKVAKDPERRRLLVRKMSRLFAEIDHFSINVHHGDLFHAGVTQDFTHCRALPAA